MWVRLDDRFHSNPKVLEVGHEAAGVYACALSYCGDHLTDGFVPARWLVQSGAREKAVELLSAHGFWEPVSKGDRRRVTGRDGSSHDVTAPADGYLIRDFLTLNMSRAEHDAYRSDRARAGRQGAIARWGNRNGTVPEPSGSRDRPTASTPPETPEMQPKRSSSQAPAIAAANDLPIATVRNERTRALEGGKINCPEPACQLPFPTRARALDHLENVHWHSREQAEQLLPENGPAA